MSSFSQGCFALTPSPMFLLKVLNSNALDEKLVCLLPTWIWPGAFSGPRGTNPEVHVYPPRVEIPTLLTMTVEEQRRGRKERREGWGAGWGTPQASAGQHKSPTHMSHFPFLLLLLNLSVASS